MYSSALQPDHRLTLYLSVQILYQGAVSAEKQGLSRDRRLPRGRVVNHTDTPAETGCSAVHARSAEILRNCGQRRNLASVKKTDRIRKEPKDLPLRPSRFHEQKLRRALRAHCGTVDPADAENDIGNKGAAGARQMWRWRITSIAENRSRAAGHDSGGVYVLLPRDSIRRSSGDNPDLAGGSG